MFENNRNDILKNFSNVIDEHRRKCYSVSAIGKRDRFPEIFTEVRFMRFIQWLRYVRSLMHA